MEVRPVLQRKDGVKMVIIPKQSEIKKGALVLVTNISDDLKLMAKFQKEGKKWQIKKKN